MASILDRPPSWIRRDHVPVEGVPSSTGSFLGLPTGRLIALGSGRGRVLGRPTGRLGTLGSGIGLVRGRPTGRLGLSGSGTGRVRGLPTGRFTTVAFSPWFLFSILSGDFGFDEFGVEPFLLLSGSSLLLSPFGFRPLL